MSDPFPNGERLHPALLPPRHDQEYLAEREEILKHKWIESETAGDDIGWARSARSVR